VRYRFKTKPYLHQVRALKFAIRRFKAGKPGVAFLMEPRTGKTKTTIDTLGCLHALYGLRKVLIVAPNRVLGTWIHEIHTHSPLNVQVIVWDKDARKQQIPPMPGAYDMQVILVNYEAFGTPGRRTKSGGRSRANGRFKYRTLIQKWVGRGPAACVLDESHKIKAPQGKAATMLVSMRGLFAYRFLLTGTPVTKAKRAHDIYQQWKFMDELPRWGTTVDDFKNHTGRWLAHNGFPQWVAAKDPGMADLKRLIHTDGFVVKREDCFDLPPREHRVIPITLDRVTARHYDEMAEEFVTMLENGEIAEASIPLVVTLRLLQITSGFVGIPKAIRGKMVSVAHRIGEEKLRALDDLLVEETLERDEKIVIVGRFNPDLNGAIRVLEKRKIPYWQVRGGIHRDVTDGNIRDFRNHTGAGAMVVQPQAASLGIDLSTSAHLVWYSLTPSWVDYTQTNDRIALSRTSTTFTYLIAPDTVDAMLYDALQMDGDVSKAIMSSPRSILRR
jgi:SNF2 family DNA or RNA helicase